jgi:hypothetical protein
MLIVPMQISLKKVILIGTIGHVRIIDFHSNVLALLMYRFCVFDEVVHGETEALLGVDYYSNATMRLQ